MNNLSSERIEYYTRLPTQPGGEKHAVFMYEVRRMASELLALREAGKEPVYQYQSGIYNDENGDTDWYWDDCDRGFYEQYASDRRRILYAAPQLPAVPDGWVMVPSEPTAEMYGAGDQQLTTKQVWDAMIAAAPKPELEIKK